MKKSRSKDLTLSPASLGRLKAEVARWGEMYPLKLKLPRRVRTIAEAEAALDLVHQVLAESDGLIAQLSQARQTVSEGATALANLIGAARRRAARSARRPRRPAGRS